MDNTAIAPPDDVINAVQAAQVSGNVDAMKGVAPLVANTSLAGDVSNSIGKMDKAIDPAKRIIANTNANGGVQSPEGRLALSQSILDEYKNSQPTKSFWQGLGLTLMGNKDGPKFMTSGGEERFLAPGDDGKFYQVVKDSNSDIPNAVLDQSGNLVPLSQAMKLGITQFKDVTNTTGFKTNLTRADLYQKANADEIASANAWASGYKTIDSNNSMIIDGLNKLKSLDLGLPTSVLTSINSVAGKTGAITKAYSNAIQSLAQATDSTSLNAGIQQANKIGAEFGMAPIKMDANHNITTDDGNSYSISNFLSKMGSTSNSSNSENAWRAGAAEIKNEAWYKNLAAKNPEMIPVFETIFNNSANNDILKKRLVENYKAPPIISPTVPFDPAKSLETNIASVLIDRANAVHTSNYSKQLGTVLSQGIPVVPGSVMNNYAQGPEYAAVNGAALGTIDKILSSYKDIKAASIPPEAIATPSTAPKNTLSPSNNKRLNKTESLSLDKQNPAVQKIDTAQRLSDLFKKHAEGAK